MVKRFSKTGAAIGLDPSLRDIRLSDLELFSALAKLGSVRLTARELGLEPSQVSRKITALEEQLEAKLVNRSPQGMSLTPIGERTNDMIQQILNQSRMLKNLSSRSRGETVVQLLGIASANYLVENLLTRVLPKLQPQFPNTRYRFIELFPDQMLLPGIRGAFEIALHTGGVDWPGTWESQKIGSIAWRLYCGVTCPLFKVADQPIPIEAIVKYPFIAPFDFSAENGFSFRNDRCPIPISHRTVGFEVQRADVAAELLVQTQQLCFLPEIVVTELIRQKKIRELSIVGQAVVEVPLFLTVQASSVSVRLRNALASGIAEELKADQSSRGDLGKSER